MVIRRRRECLSCFLRYTTYERIEETPLRVVKKSGERVRFDRDRILAGMVLACEKLPVSSGDLEAAVVAIEHKIQEDYDREVPSTVIGALVMESLKELDPVAYVRFASVYREFKNISEFLDELRGMVDQQSGTKPAQEQGR